MLTGTKYSVRTDIMFTPRQHQQQKQQHIQQQQKRKSLSGSLWNHAGGLLRGSFHRNGGGQ